MRLFLAAFMTLTACQATPAERPVAHHGPNVIAPAAAVLAAADAAPRGYPGRFGFTVMRAEQVGPRFFLNSQPDYRDQRNLAIAIEYPAAQQLRRAYGADVQAAYLGKSIQVDGIAQRQRIDFTIGGRPSGKYYYQTHVVVMRPDQIALMP